MSVTIYNTSFGFDITWFCFYYIFILKKFNKAVWFILTEFLGDRCCSRKILSLIFIRTVQGRYYYTHFKDEKNKSSESNWRLFFFCHVGRLNKMSCLQIPWENIKDLFSGINIQWNRSRNNSYKFFLEAANQTDAWKLT